MKKILSLVLTAALSFSVVGCGTKADAGNKDDKTIKVGATPVPHKEILEHIAPALEKEGYKLEIVEFEDYQLINPSLANKELDANFFQHIPFLEGQNSEKKYDLTYTAKVHIEPLGFYSKHITDIKDLKDGSTIAVPNDATNEARALRLLEKNGLIKVKEGDLVTVQDITENTKNLKIMEVDAAQLPRILVDVQGAVINTNYALAANLVPTKDALFIEESDSPYVNILAVRQDNKDSEKIKALTKTLTSEDVKKFIEEKYKGSVVPAF